MSRQVNAGDPGSGFPSKITFNQNGSIADADLTIVGVKDPTKSIIFDASAQTKGKSVTISAGANSANVVFTLPTTSGTLATVAGSTYTPPQSQLQVYGCAGYGQTGGCTVIRFGSQAQSTGTDITWTTSGTNNGNGDKFTLNTTGIYCIDFSNYGLNTTAPAGLTKNSSSTSTSIASIAYPERMTIVTLGNNSATCASFTGLFTAGDVVRLIGDGSSALSADNLAMLNITRIA